MSRYKVHVQLLRWYEVIVLADSPEEAVDKAELLSPRQIQSRGKRLRVETGLADVASVELAEKKSSA